MSAHPSETRRPTYNTAEIATRYQVDIDDEQKSLKVDHKRIAEITRELLAAEKCVSATISIAIVDNDTIHDLNQRYLQHDYATDVLSFLLECEIEPESLPIPKSAPRGAGKRIEGEIIVSAEMAQELATKYRWQPLDELTLYVVHGLLHLCGYDDLSAKELKVMRLREQEVLKAFSLTPHYAEE
jgi:probable rRNA maturation factor